MIGLAPRTATHDMQEQSPALLASLEPAAFDLSPSPDLALELQLA